MVYARGMQSAFGQIAHLTAVASCYSYALSWSCNQARSPRHRACITRVRWGRSWGVRQEQPGGRASIPLRQGL